MITISSTNVVKKNYYATNETPTLSAEVRYVVIVSHEDGSRNYNYIRRLELLEQAEYCFQVM